MKWARAAGVAAAVGLSGIVAPPVQAVHPVPPYQPPLPGARVVHVGGGDLRNDVVTEAEVQFQAFYPETMQVHRGDTVEWRFAHGFATFHTVTFQPEDMDVARAPLPLDGAHDPFIRADELPGALAFSEDLLLGSGCGLIFEDTINGRPAQRPCDIRTTDRRYSSQASDGLLNINAPQSQGFAAVINLPPGRYRYHCNFHPSMHGYVEVVDGKKPLPSQAQIDAAARAALEADLATARELQRAQSVPTSTLHGDQRAWTVHVGATSADGRVSINDYLPSEVKLDPGDAVHFVAEGVEPNTVTFPKDVVGSFTLEGCDTASCDGHLVPTGVVIAVAPPACEFDDPARGLPGLPTWIPTAGCRAGSKLEVQLSALATEPTRAPKNRIVSPVTFHNSGFMMDTARQPRWYADRPGDRDWLRTFDAVFPSEGTFTYSCLIHTGDPWTAAVIPARRGMVGTIKVRRRS
jgi:plastocyanin